MADDASTGPMAATTGRRTRMALAAAVLLGTLAGCSDGPGDDGADRSEEGAAEVDPGAVVDLAAVDVSPIPSGGGVPNGSAATLPDGYREDEYLLSGTAAVYAGPVTGPVTVEREGDAFTTRILVRAPSDPAEFSGSVWVEPYNTSAGSEADVVWSALAPLVEERGDAWVGVTVRAGQVEPHQEFDPVRYADLDLAENAYAWDMLRELGALLKTNDEASPLADAGVDHVYVGGYSQSAVDAATFATAFHERTRLDDGAPVYDGYLLGGRESNLSPLQSGDTLIPQFERAPLPPVDVPVVNLESQTDVEGFEVEVPTELARQQGVAGAEDVDTPTFSYVNVGGAFARRDDSDTDDDRYRLYEVPGAPHAGNGPDASCAGVSTFPTMAFMRGAGAHLARWAEEGEAPPEAPRIELATLDEVSVAANDEHGNALGGVRSPFVDVPLYVYRTHAAGGPFCVLSGEERPLATDALQQRYGDAEGYLADFAESLDATIEAGFLLELDRQPILDTARTNAAAVFP